MDRDVAHEIARRTTLGHAIERAASGRMEDVLRDVAGLPRLLDGAGRRLLRLTDDPYPGAVAFAYETAWPRVQEFLPAEITPRGR